MRGRLGYALRCDPQRQYLTRRRVWQQARQRCWIDRWEHFTLKSFAYTGPGAGHGTLRQELAGCCATDAHTYLGQWPADFPVILGRERWHHRSHRAGRCPGLSRARGAGGGRSSPAQAAVAPVMSAAWRTSPDAVAICGSVMASPGHKTLRSAVVTASTSISARRRRPLCSKIDARPSIAALHEPLGWRRMPCAAPNPGSEARWWCKEAAPLGCLPSAWHAWPVPPAPLWWEGQGAPGTSPGVWRGCHLQYRRAAHA